MFINVNLFGLYIHNTILLQQQIEFIVIMKELTIEEKAARYDEAIEKAKECHTDGLSLHQPVKDILEHIFPEIKESEDERIRKKIINLIEKSNEYGGYALHKWEADEMLAWIEKQGQHANFRNKIQVGDKVTRNEDGVLVNLSQLNRVAKKQGEQKLTNKVEPKFKIGDWVVWDNKILCHVDSIYQGKESLMYTIIDTNNMTHSYSVKGFDNNAHLWTIQDAKDGDLLADNYGIYIFDRFDEYDEKCYICRGAYQYSQKDYENEHMLCSVEVHPATKEQRDLLYQKMKEAGYEWDAEKKELKKIEQKPAWSEEDEEMLNYIICDIESLKEQVYCKTLCDEEIDWLKNLKDRLQPQSTWKPSDEQMRELKNVFDCSTLSWDEDILESLYNDLKKLKGYNYGN